MTTRYPLAALDGAPYHRPQPARKLPPGAALVADGDLGGACKVQLPDQLAFRVRLSPSARRRVISPAAW